MSNYGRHFILRLLTFKYHRTIVYVTNESIHIFTMLLEFQDKASNLNITGYIYPLHALILNQLVHVLTADILYVNQDRKVCNYLTKEGTLYYILSIQILLLFLHIGVIYLREFVTTITLNRRTCLSLTRSILILSLMRRSINKTNNHDHNSLRTTTINSNTFKVFAAEIGRRSYKNKEL